MRFSLERANKTGRLDIENNFNSFSVLFQKFKQFIGEMRKSAD